MKVSLEFLKSRTADERWRMYQNALRLGGPEAEALIQLIRDHNLSVHPDGGLTEDHPIIKAIHDVCYSDKAKAAALKATAEGLPAMALVDPLLQGVAGYDLPDTHSWAGTYVAQVMDQLGYRPTQRRAKLPVTCRAKSALVFERKPAIRSAPVGG